MLSPRLKIVGIGWVVLMTAGLAAAAAAPAANTGVPHTAEGIGKKREALATQIARLSPTDKDASLKTSVRSAADDETLTLLRTLDALYAQYQTRLVQRQQLEVQAKEADKELESLDKFAPDEPKPYSFLLLEGLKDQLAAEEDRERAIKADLKSAEQLLQASHDELDESASDRQESATKELAKQSSKADDSIPKPSRAELTIAVARARIALKQIEIELHTAQLTLSQTKQKQLTKKIDTIAKDVAFSADDRDKRLARLTATEAETKGRRREAEAHFRQIDSERQSTLKELADQKAPQQVVDAATEAWRTAADVYQTEAVILDQQIENLGVLRRSWKHRYDLASGNVDAQKMSRWLDELDEFVDQLDDMSRSLEHRRESLHADQAVVPNAEGQSANEAVAKWTAVRQARLQELRDLCEASMDDIKANERTLSRFRGELKAKLKATGIWGSGVGGSLAALMNYKLTDDKQALTVGKLLVLLVSIIGGMILAYFISRIIGRRVLPLLGLNRGATSALKSIAFYALCLIFGIAAFQLLHIPLAAFAFLGGAAAIAVGFGSQDIMNNFMSGIILLSEQPIRVGDVVELKDVQGEVLHIGLRSTRLRTKSNHEMIVPNKSLLDEQVTNLTLSDSFVQVLVTVTVDGAVEVQKAKRQMLQIAFFHPLVLKSPRPVVLLKEYDSFYGCMTFEVHFSLQLDSVMKCAMVQSDILEAISDLFKAKKDGDATKTEATETADVAAVDAVASNGTLPEETTPVAQAGPAAVGESALLAGLSNLSPLAVLREIKQAHALKKAKV